jgi:hypothetical protein
MKITGLFLLLGAISILIGASQVTNFRKTLKEPLSMGSSTNPPNFAVVSPLTELRKLLRQNRVAAFGEWQTGDRDENRLWYVVVEFDKESGYVGAGQKITILDNIGRVLYEDRFTNLLRAYSTYALRKPSPQLVLEVDYGGSSSFLEMLDYRDGKIVDLMAKVKPNNDFDVGAEIRPQLKTLASSAKEPYQILLTEGVGLASPVEKRTKVIRYVNGAYSLLGDFPAKKMDEYMEEILTR